MFLNRERRTSHGERVQRLVCHAARPEVEPRCDRAVPRHAWLPGARDGEELLCVFAAPFLHVATLLTVVVFSQMPMERMRM